MQEEGTTFGATGGGPATRDRDRRAAPAARLVGPGRPAAVGRQRRLAPSAA